MTKQIEQKFKKLDEVSHVLLRPGRYLGSISPHTALSWYYDLGARMMRQKEMTWCPALLKVFDEIISNSVDFSKTEAGSHVLSIRVEVDKDTGQILVRDDGGIPVVIHKETNQYVPEMIYELRAGSNFNDEEEHADNEFGTGQNGEGAALTCIFSTEFNVHTSDGTNSFIQTHTNNSRTKTSPKIKPSSKHFTEIKWIPDYEKFGLSGLDEDNFLMLLKRTVDIAACNPKLRIYFNEEKINIRSFSDYIRMYQEDFIFEQNDNWKVGIAHADDGFEHISFVNSTMTKTGGNHIDYVAYQIVAKLRDFFKKKHKVDVKPNEIRNHLRLFIDCQIVRPRYDSQTKDLLITEIRNFGTSFEVSDKFIKALTQSPIIQSVLDWVEAKEKANELAELRKMNKDVNRKDPKAVPKFHDATSKDRSNTMLLLVEGDSALSGVLSGRDPKLHGAFPLRGKPINVYEMDVKEVVENNEFKNIVTILGLQLGVKVKDPSDIRFDKIVLTTDQDLDGYSIRGLLLNTFYKFWPELFEMGKIYILNTPLVKITVKNKVIPFYSIEDFEQWQLDNKNVSYKSKYYKGLGTSGSKEWKEYFSEQSMNESLVQLKLETKEDKEMFKLLFSKERGMTDRRKDWLQLQENGV